MILLLLGSAALEQACAQAGGISRSAAAAWLAGYEAAWENRDPAAAAALFAADARYYETPYAEPFVGPDGIREYWAGVTADQRDVEFDASLIAIDGSTAVASWSATFRLASNGANVELRGVFALEFGGDGKCAVLREWWHAQ